MYTCMPSLKLHLPPPKKQEYQNFYQLPLASNINGAVTTLHGGRLHCTHTAGLS